MSNPNKVNNIAQAPEGVKNKTQYLTERNQEIFNLRAQGYTYTEIARHPRINLSTQRVAFLIKNYKRFYETK